LFVTRWHPVFFLSHKDAGKPVIPDGFIRMQTVIPRHMKSPRFPFPAGHHLNRAGMFLHGMVDEPLSFVEMNAP